MYSTAADLLRFAPIVTAAIPELAPCVGFDQHNPHHLYDIYEHTARVVECVPRDLTLRWAALLHDVGKPDSFTQEENGRGHFYGHPKISADMADVILRRLKAPTALRDDVVFLCDRHMVTLEPDRKLLRRRLSQYGEARTKMLLAIQRVDLVATGTRTADEASYYDEVEAILNTLLAEDQCFQIRDLAVGGNDLMALGLKGRAIGQTLQTLLNLVIEEQVPNEREALLDAAKQYTKQKD